MWLAVGDVGHWVLVVIVLGLAVRGLLALIDDLDLLPRAPGPGPNHPVRRRDEEWPDRERLP